MKAPAETAPQSAGMQGWLEAKPGVTTSQVAGPGGRPPTSTMYKVGGKLFAILAIRGAPWVIVKSDPHLVEILREQYAGVGHRAPWRRFRPNLLVVLAAPLSVGMPLDRPPCFGTCQRGKRSNSLRSNEGPVPRPPDARGFDRAPQRSRQRLPL